MMNARTAVSDHPGGMDDDRPAAAVATRAAHIRAATSRRLVLIAKLDRRNLRAANGPCRSRTGSVDHDQGIMVAMASWGPCRTGSGAAATPANASPP